MTLCHFYIRVSYKLVYPSAPSAIDQLTSKWFLSMLLISLYLTNYPSFTPSEECVSQRKLLTYCEHVSVPFSLQIDERNLLNPRRTIFPSVSKQTMGINSSQEDLYKPKPLLHITWLPTWFVDNVYPHPSEHAHAGSHYQWAPTRFKTTYVLNLLSLLTWAPTPVGSH